MINNYEIPAINQQQAKEEIIWLVGHHMQLASNNVDFSGRGSSSMMF